MAKLLFSILIVLGLVLTCRATSYTVGDSCGWDISCDMDAWRTGKNFKVGDILSFQFSSYHSVYEVNKDSFDGCNVSNPIMTSTTGNSTITLSNPGDKYFVCGNRLHCLGGMKLRVNVQQNGTISPASAPLPPNPRSPSSLPQPSSKNNVPVSTSSSRFVRGGWTSVLSSSLGFAISAYIFAF
ncbi:hypothetical protein ACHQM5_007326 [Ranunculus cassubicifolius]